MMRKDAYFFKLGLVAIFFWTIISGSSAFGQLFNDGPIQLRGRLRNFNITFPETDVAFFGVVGTPDDLSYNVWGREPVNNGVSWTQGLIPGITCSGNSFLENYTPPLNNWNVVFYDFTTPTPAVGGGLEVRLDTWEDESPDQLLGIGCGGSRCAYDIGFCCGGFLFGVCLGAIDDDDLHCASGSTTPYTTLNYRLGPPCQWFNHGVQNGACANDVYHPTLETFWRYTNGNGCANAIQLGAVAPGFTTITHFNSNECYANTHPFVNGNDVTYQINITQPIGLVVNTCGAGSMPSDIYLLNSGCSQLFSNSGFCGNGSQISTPICQPGIYYIVVEGRAAAQGTFTLQVSENPSLVVQANAGPNVSVCSGLGVNIGAQLPQLPASGGQGPYNYSWTPTTFLTSTNTPTTTAFPPTTTVYTLTVTDALGCQSQDSTIVTVNPGPIVNLGPDVTVCPNTTVPLDAGGGFSIYFWNTGAFSQTVTVTNPGQYLAVVTDIFGCIGRDTMNLFNHALPPVSLGPDTSICLGQALPLSVANTYPFYAWSTGATSQSISTTASGTYSVTVTDGNACTNRDTVIVGVDTLPTPILPPIVGICPGSNAVLNPGAGWPDYVWNNGNINQLLITNTVGPYSVTVTDGNGCVGTTSTNVMNFTTPLGFGVTAPANFFCSGTNITLDAGSGPNIASYYWSNLANTQTTTVNSSGIYHVTVTDINGCQWEDSIQVTEAPLPTVELGPNRTICQGQSTLLIAPPGYTYSWSTSQSGQIISVTTAGTYTVTVTNPGTNCSATDDITITVLPNPAPNLPSTVTLCAGESTTLDPGSGFSSYTWSTGAISQSITVTTPGSYTVTATNPNGCQSTATTVLSNYAAPVAVVSGNANGCLGHPETLVATGGFSSYAWSNAATTQAIVVNGTGTYTVTATDANGCEAVASLTINFGPEPVLNIPSVDTVCIGAQQTLDAGPGFTTYLWSTGETTQTIQAGGQGAYGITVTNASGCSTSGSIFLVKSNTYPVDLGAANQQICDRGEIMLLAGPQYTSYQWSNGSGNQFLNVTQPGTYSVTATDAWGCVSNDAVTITAAGLNHLDFLPTAATVCAGETYLIDAGAQWDDYLWGTGNVDQYFLTTTPGVFYVTVTDPSGCRFYDSVEVVVETPPTLELGPNVNVCPNEVLDIDAGSGYDSYLWSTGATTQTIQISQPGDYQVTVTFNGCVLQDIMNIGDDCPGRIFIPNVFSPNGDGLNDFFQVTYINLETITVKIYDRWGKFLYTSNDKDFKWNGRFNDNPLPEGTYYWTINYKFTDNENPEEKRGTVMILR